MGSNWFGNCSLDERFMSGRLYPRESGGEQHLVWDWDTRRCIDVYAPEGADKDFVFEAIAEFIDDLPAEIVQVELSDEGQLIASSSQSDDDRSWVPFYPARSDFPVDAATLRRTELTEVERFGVGVDLVTYAVEPGQARCAMFKYYFCEHNVARAWHEANCVLRMPAHPYIVPFEALVVDDVEGVDRVVGFMTRFIPGGTLHSNRDRVFKLKYVKQLIEVVDHLNLRLGIVHSDLCPWNLLIDPETDDIQLFDFNCAAKLGWEGDTDNRLEFEYEADCNDVKFLLFTVYEMITHEFCFRAEFYPHELDASTIMNKQTWEQHPDAFLDEPVEEYRRVLAEWAYRRAEIDQTVDHFTKASEPLDWPPLRVDPDMATETRGPKRRGRLRSVMLHLGRTFLTWERPPTAALPLPEGQRLLASGEVVWA